MREGLYAWSCIYDCNILVSSKSIIHIDLDSRSRLRLAHQLPQAFHAVVLHDSLPILLKQSIRLIVVLLRLAWVQSPVAEIRVDVAQNAHEVIPIMKIAFACGMGRPELAYPHRSGVGAKQISPVVFHIVSEGRIRALVVRY